MPAAFKHVLDTTRRTVIVLRIVMKVVSARRRRAQACISLVCTGRASVRCTVLCGLWEDADLRRSAEAAAAGTRPEGVGAGAGLPAPPAVEKVLSAASY